MRQYSFNGKIAKKVVSNLRGEMKKLLISTCVAHNESFDILGVNVMDELSLEVILELLVGNGGKQGTLYNGGNVGCDLLSLLHIDGN